MAAEPATTGGDSERILMPATINVEASPLDYEPAIAGLCDGVRDSSRWWQVWRSTDGAYEHWIVLTFAETVTVQAVAVHWKVTDGEPWSPRAYSIQYWEGGRKGEFKDIVAVTDNPPAPYVLHAFDAIKTTRIRVLQPACSGSASHSNAMGVAEVEVYNYPKQKKEFGTQKDRDQQLQVQHELRANTIGVFRRARRKGNYRDIQTTLALTGKRVIGMDYLDEQSLKRCSAVVVGDCRCVPDKSALINFIANGGGVLFLHESCGRAGGSPLPNIWTFEGMGSGDLAIRDATHPATRDVAAGITPSFPSHARLKCGKAGTVIAADSDGNAVVVAGKLGEGKVMAMGNFPGLMPYSNNPTCGVKMQPVSAKTINDENKLLLNSVRWLADGAQVRDEWKESPEAKAWRARNEAAKRQFTDVTEQTGMTRYGHSKCVALADVHETGNLDIFATMHGIDRNFLFRNDGNWKFEDISKKAGVQMPQGIGSVFADLNADGHLDLFVSWMPELGSTGRTTLYFGDGKGGFQDGTDAAGLSNVTKISSCMMNDVDHDGRLDLYMLGNEAGNTLYRGRPDGTFEDATAAFGLAGLGSREGGGYGDIAASLVDLDGDGFADLACFSQGRLRIFRNKGGKGFEEVADFLGAGAAPIAGSSLGMAVGDVDNDGDQDLFVAGVNRLLRNDGKMRFADVTAASKLSSMEMNASPYTALLFDYNNDGWLDLFLTMVDGDLDGAVYRNNGDGTFKDVSWDLGLDAHGTHGCNVGDLDGDGDLDFYGTAWGMCECRLLRNNQDDSHFIKVRVKGQKPNTTGIGARIWVYEEGIDKPRTLRGYREVLGGIGCMYTCPVLEQHFGLPDGDTYRVEVLFPASGKRVTVPNVAAGTTIMAEETK